MFSDDAKRKLWFYCMFAFAALSLLMIFRLFYLIHVGEIRLTPEGVLMKMREPSLKTHKRYNWHRRDVRTVSLPRLYPIFRFGGPVYCLVMALYSFIISVLYKSSDQRPRQYMAKGWLLGSFIWFGLDFYIRWQAWHR